MAAVRVRFALVCVLIFAAWGLTAAEPPGNAANQGDATLAALGLDPQLPNVLVIGDSISLGAMPELANLLRGKANVFHCGGAGGNNAGSSTMSLGSAPTDGPAHDGVRGWLAGQGTYPHYPGLDAKASQAKYREQGASLARLGVRWDVVQCNVGLWDVVREPLPNSPETKLVTPLETYQANLTKIAA